MKTAKNPIDLSRGNNKIHKALIWNLPDAITCPGATELCKQVCYAHDAAVLHNNVVPQYRARNLEIAHRADFRDLMIQKLKRARLPRMRVHESGDFFNQKYLNDWVEIIKEIPNKEFWIYTKSWMLDFTELLKLPNVTLRYSVDVTTKKYPKQDIPHAVVSAERNDLFVCPSSEVSGHKIKCMKDCFFCTESKEGLIFRPHGQRSARVGELEAASK